MSDRSPERFLYIAGTSFTGSTLLSFLLNLHPQIVGVGEMTGPFRGVEDRRGYPCSCGAALSECPFWTAVGQEMAGRALLRLGQALLLKKEPQPAQAAEVLGRAVEVLEKEAGSADAEEALRARLA